MRAIKAANMSDLLHMAFLRGNMQEVTEFHSGQKVLRVAGCSLFLLLVFNFEIPHRLAVYFVQGHLEPESAFY